jgi:uncharacterized protein (TIGR00369 family)
VKAIAVEAKTRFFKFSSKRVSRLRECNEKRILKNFFFHVIPACGSAGYMKRDELELTEAQRKRVEGALDTVPFAKLLGIQVEEVVEGRSVLTMPVRPDLKQNHGVVHGGAIASLIDSAMAFAIIPLLAEKERTTTVDLTIHYLRPLTEGVAKSTARVVRAGRRVITVSAEVVDHKEQLVATAVSTYLRLTPDAN